MIIKELDEKMPMIGTGNLERSGGIHLSDVIKYINKSLGRSKGDG
jgi:hypothetical protein